MRCINSLTAQHADAVAAEREGQRPGNHRRAVQPRNRTRHDDDPELLAAAFQPKTPRRRDAAGGHQLLDCHRRVDADIDALEKLEAIGSCPGRQRPFEVSETLDTENGEQIYLSGIGVRRRTPCHPSLHTGDVSGSIPWCPTHEVRECRH